MLRRTKEAIAPASPERGLAYPSITEPVTWFSEMERWFDDLRRDFESAVWPPFRASTLSRRTA